MNTSTSYIKLSKWISLKKAVINPKNEYDEECFKYAVIAALHHHEIANHPERISKLKPYIDNYNWEGLKFPLPVEKIKKFEKNNIDIAVNVLFIHRKEDDTKQGKISILRRSKFNTARNKIVNLLLLNDGEKSHYTCIKSISRLLGKENSKNERKQHFCLNCLTGFQEQVSRDKHYIYCVPDTFKTPELCLYAVAIFPSCLKHIPDHLKTPELCQQAVARNIHCLRYVPDWFIPSISDCGCCDSCDKTFDDLIKLYEQRKALKADIKKELLPITWHPDRVLDWCFDEDEKKDLVKLWR